MNKDIKGLIKYFLSIIITILLFLYSVKMFFLGFFMSLPLKDDTDLDFVSNCMLIGIIGSFIFPLITIYITSKAYNNNQSKYLTVFFNAIPLHCVILCIMFFIMFFSEHFDFSSHFYLEQTFKAYSSFFNFVFPIYLFYFLIIIFNKLSNKLSKFVYDNEKNKKICLFLYAIINCLFAGFCFYNLWSFGNGDAPLFFVPCLLVIFPIFLTIRAYNDNWNLKLTKFFDMVPLHIIVILICSYISKRFFDMDNSYVYHAHTFLIFTIHYLLIFLSVLYCKTRRFIKRFKREKT